LCLRAYPSTALYKIHNPLIASEPPTNKLVSKRVLTVSVIQNGMRAPF